jgi:CTP:molybdopterin cytidylyltransferase MocA
MKSILNQLARNTGLLPDELATAILAGDMPPVEEIAMALVIGAMDAHAVVVGSVESSWNEKRFARMALAVAFLSAMAVAGKTGEPTWT